MCIRDRYVYKLLILGLWLLLTSTLFHIEAPDLKYRARAYSIILLVTHFFQNYLSERKTRQLFLESKLKEQDLLNIKRIINDTLRDSVIVCNKSVDRIIYANREAHAEFPDLQDGLFSLLRETKIFQYGRHFQKQDQEESDETLENVLRQSALQRGKQQRFQGQKRHKEEGSIKYYDIRLEDCFWDHLPCYCIVVSDISDRVMNAQLRAKDEYKNFILATVSHDLRTPLTGMVGMIQTASDILQGEDQQRVRPYLENAVSFSKLLMNFINDILDQSQLRQGTLRINCSRFALASVLENIRVILKYNIEAKGCLLYTSPSPRDQA
eukprot:TRINITY_DN14721_c0_g1_i1.p1 TRINITY_DN14721_c0_g1~~TRINITY_DN14721_c0_g1_i1.p1  ORF type:complete len:324 (-),score=43.67 TRINITY_DN14721_c0_g1_i1:35-1006(-)